MKKMNEFKRMVEYIKMNGDIIHHDNDFDSYVIYSINNSSLIYNEKFNYITLIVDNLIQYHIKDCKVINAYKELIKVYEDYGIFNDTQEHICQVFIDIFEKMNEEG